MIRQVSWLIAAAYLASAQPPAGAPQFEVASVKLSDPYSHVGSDVRVQPGGKLIVTNQRLRVIIREAFAVRYYQMLGGPAWLDSDQFDIEAKAPQDNPTREQVMAMLQTLLADRFQLKVHRETREGNAYALVVAKNGPRLQPPSDKRSRIALIRITPPDKPGVKYAMEGTKASMALFAQDLSDRVRRPVLDQTGLQGEYNFRVDFSTEDDPEPGPTLLMALQDQLGLKLEATKSPIETLVIDHVQKPSAN